MVDIFEKKLMLMGKKVKMVTLTVTTDPSAATCTLTYDGQSYTTKSATVPQGTNISYSINHSTYGTTTGSITMDKDKTLNCKGTSSTTTRPHSVNMPPNLTSNGTMGGTTYAVSASSEYSSSNAAWKASDLDGTTTYWRPSTASTGQTYVVYFPPSYALRVYKASVRSIDSVTKKVYSNFTLQYSSDGINYTTLSPSTAPTSTETTGYNYVLWSISYKAPSTYYQYWKFTFTEITGSSGILGVSNISLSGYYLEKITTYRWTATIT